MITFKCKMCGGDLHPEDNATTCECEYCGSVQTIPTADNEKKMNLFGRAQRLLRACEFDKAAGVYESIVAEFPEEAEAYWGLVLCKYGIEYVDDPGTGKKVPTCHRSSFDSVMENGDFEQACENADTFARRVYRDEAKAIEGLRKGIIEVSGKEEPYDIFICYKETDENGDRTLDSVIAQDIYNELTEKGYRVFFSRITLEDKLGQEYEPYIFAALNSAKVMLAVGTDYEFYNAVWVKNEWSRFLQLIASGEKKALIPCYKGIDAYDMPKEFARLQAQDMGKVGAMQDLLRGIVKIIPKRNAAEAISPAGSTIHSSGASTSSLIERGMICLEDGEWNKATTIFDQVLNMDAQNADAYLGILMAENKLHCLEDILQISNTTIIQNMVTGSKYQRFIRYATDEKKRTISIYIEQARELISNKMTQMRTQSDAASHLFDVHGQLVALKYDGTVIALGSSGSGSETDGQWPVQKWSEIKAVVAGSHHIVGLRNDGTVVATKNTMKQSNLNSWVDIISVAAGDDFTVGLKQNGTIVIATIEDTTLTIWRDVHRWTDRWSNINSLFVTGNGSDLVGITLDGKVYAIGEKFDGSGVFEWDTKEWDEIISVVTGYEHLVGLKSDGSVIATGNNEYGQCNVDKWTDIIQIAAFANHTIGLKADGTVVAAGENTEGQCNISNWSDIVTISTFEDHTAGLKTDGSVVAIGSNDFSQCNVQNWSGIIAIKCGLFTTWGLRFDGTLLTTDNDFDLKSVKLFDSYNTLDQEREEATKKRLQQKTESIKTQMKQNELQKNIAQLEDEIMPMRQELSNLAYLAKHPYSESECKQISEQIEQLVDQKDKLKWFQKSVKRSIDQQISELQLALNQKKEACQKEKRQYQKEYEAKRKMYQPKLDSLEASLKSFQEMLEEIK